MSDLDARGKRTRGRLWVYHTGDPEEAEQLRQGARSELAEGYGIALLEQGRDPATGLAMEVWNVVCIRHLH